MILIPEYKRWQGPGCRLDPKGRGEGGCERPGAVRLASRAWQRRWKTSLKAPHCPVTLSAYSQSSGNRTRARSSTWGGDRGSYGDEGACREPSPLLAF